MLFFVLENANIVWPQNLLLISLTPRYPGPAPSTVTCKAEEVREKFKWCKSTRRQRQLRRGLGLLSPLSSYPAVGQTDCYRSAKASRDVNPIYIQIISSTQLLIGIWILFDRLLNCCHVNLHFFMKCDDDKMTATFYFGKMKEFCKMKHRHTEILQFTLKMDLIP